MLNQLVDLLRAGGVHRIADLARVLETTPELVEVMLEDLVRMGYLKQVGGQCGQSCAGCSLAGLCAAGEGGRVWALTDKGGSLDVTTPRA